MTEDFRPPPRSPHRYVPTLTEVVAHPASNPPVASLEITRELFQNVVDQAFRRAEDALTQRLPEVLAVMLHEQALAMSERVRHDIRIAVRESVIATLAEMLPDLRIAPGPDDAAMQEKPDAYY
jgi:hypothetical protein